MKPPVFQIVPVASCAVTEHHWEGPGTIFFTTYPQIFIQVAKLPAVPSLLRAKQSLFRGSHQPPATDLEPLSSRRWSTVDFGAWVNSSWSQTTALHVFGVWQNPRAWNLCCCQRHLHFSPSPVLVQAQQKPGALAALQCLASVRCKASI